MHPSNQVSFNCQALHSRGADSLPHKRHDNLANVAAFEHVVDCTRNLIHSSVAM